MSKLVTKNDLTGILNEVLPIPQGTQYELIWTNPNGNSQTSTMGASTITANTSLSKYDGFMAEFRCYYDSGDKTYGFNMKGMSGMFSRVTTTRGTGNPVIEYTRSWYPSSDTQFAISDCTRITSNSADITGQDTGCLVPIRIWGIILKATGVSPIQEDYIVEQGTDSNGWYYRKWQSGYMEASINVSSPTLGTASTVNGVIRQVMTMPTPPTMVTKYDINASGTNSGCWVAYGFDSSNNPTVSVHRISGSVIPNHISISIKGTWK